MNPTLDRVFGDPRRPVITAHRGLSGCRPENTLTAFQAALAAGADIIEFDVRETRDGIPVILHDDSLDRTTDGQGRLHDWPWEAVRGLEASFWSGTHDAGRRLTAPAEPGTRVPCFEEVLEALAGRICMNIQIYLRSRAVLEDVCRLLRRHAMTASAFLMLPDIPNALAVHAIDPDLQVAIGTDRDQPQRHADAGARYYQPWRRLLTPALLQEASRLGLRTSVFYANNAEDMNAIWDMGFQGILTDRCDLAHEVRRQRTDGSPTAGAQSHDGRGR